MIGLCAIHRFKKTSNCQESIGLQMSTEKKNSSISHCFLDFSKGYPVYFGIGSLSSCLPELYKRFLCFSKGTSRNSAPQVTFSNISFRQALEILGTMCTVALHDR